MKNLAFTGWNTNMDDKQELLGYIEEYTEDNLYEPTMVQAKFDLKIPQMRLYKAYNELLVDGSIVECKRSSNYRLK